MALWLSLNSFLVNHMAMRWYVVQTNPKLENLACENLKNQNYEVFMPLFKKKYFKKSVLYTVCNLFPGYVFVSFDVDLDPWRSINGTRGVKKILSMDRERPSPVQESFICEMMGKVADDGFIAVEEANEALVKFNKGDAVKITSGAFQGHTGIYEISEKKRIAILLSCFGGKNRVWLDPSQVSIQVP